MRVIEHRGAHPEVTDSLPIRSLKIKSPTSDTSAAPPTSEADRNEICLYFLRQHCSFKGEIAVSIGQRDSMQHNLPWSCHGSSNCGKYIEILVPCVFPNVHIPNQYHKEMAVASLTVQISWCWVLISLQTSVYGCTTSYLIGGRSRTVILSGLICLIWRTSRRPTVTLKKQSNILGEPSVVYPRSPLPPSPTTSSSPLIGCGTGKTTMGAGWSMDRTRYHSITLNHLAYHRYNLKGLNRQFMYDTSLALAPQRARKNSLIRKEEVEKETQSGGSLHPKTFKIS